MKLSQSLRVALITAGLTIPSTLADFIIIQDLGSPGAIGVGQILLACPANYYNCDCMLNGNRRADGMGMTSEPVFSVKGGLCGMGQLNFYQQSDGHWDLYVNNGDGSLQGRCYGDSRRSMCPNPPYAIDFLNQMVCYSHICGN